MRGAQLIGFCLRANLRAQTQKGSSIVTVWICNLPGPKIGTGGTQIVMI